MDNFDLTWWISFNVGLLALLIIDFCLLRKTDRKVTSKEAITLTCSWITLALLFSVLIAYTRGQAKGLEFLTGYIIELSLSVDNLFVFLLIFQYFNVPEHLQPRVLLWGILGALVMRLSFIVVGIALVSTFHWILYIFGIFLVITGILLFKKQDHEIDPSKNPLIRLGKKLFPVTDTWENGHFFVRRKGTLFATPLFLVLLSIESSDVIFALDSIPAVFAITLDPFIVYSCNAFAILGLRTLYFVLNDLLRYFWLLHYGVCLILIYVGAKMLVAPFFTIPTVVSLSVVITIISVSVVLSNVIKRN